MIVKFSGASNEELNRTPLVLPNTFKKIKDLFAFISKEHPETRESFLEVDGTVKDGTLVIVDDQDWELLGSEEYELQGEDIILISSLHGG